MKKNKIYPEEAHIKLSRQTIDEAVEQFVIKLDLSGGSSGDINLYKLLKAYLLQPECRSKMNVIANEYAFKTTS